MSDGPVQRGTGLDAGCASGYRLQGVMAHLFFTVPTALVIKRRLSPNLA